MVMTDRVFIERMPAGDVAIREISVEEVDGQTVETVLWEKLFSAEQWEAVKQSV